jgi:hypothetical protein
VRILDIAYNIPKHTDLKAAMRPKEVSDRLQLDKIAKDHVWKVEPSCATTGEGIFEGLVSTIFFKHGKRLLTRTGMAVEQRQAPSGRQISLSSFSRQLPQTRLHAHIPGFLHIPGSSL